jgi:hypothetical protein
MAGALNAPRRSAGNYREFSVFALLILFLAFVLTVQPTRSAQAQTEPSRTLIRAVNLGGDALTIGDSAWLANSGETPSLVTNATAACNRWISFTPQASDALATMLSCWREHWAHDMVLSDLPNGTVDVYLYALQSWNNTAATPFNIVIQGAQVGNFNPGTAEGRWAKLGPYTTTVSNGRLSIATNSGTAVLSGIEVWARDGAANPPAQVSPPVEVAASLAGSSIPNNIRQSLAAGGVNLTFSFYDVDTYNPNGFDAELPLIAAAGARHVRIPISLDIIEQGTSGVLRQDRYQDIVNFVNRARGYGLVTIIDIHNTNQKRPDGYWNEDYMGGLRDEGVRVRHLSLMTEFVRKLYQDNVDRSWFVFQPANEPIFVWGDQDVWYNHQAALLPAMRQACPDCVFFAMAHDWQGVEATYRNIDPTRAPFNDPNLIFDVHFYDPITLTHCAYPGQPNNCAGLQWPSTFSTWRGDQFWDRNFIASLLQPLWEWRDRYGVFVHFSEFGTTAMLAENVRAAYVGDMANLFRQNSAGYTLYDWSGTFGTKQHPSVVRAAFSPPAASATLNVTVSIQGRSAANTALTVFDGATEQSVTTDANGRFVLTNLPVGTQTLRVKHAQTLAAVVTVNLVAGANSVSVGPLLSGDVNNDNQVTLSDFSIMASRFNLASGQPGFTPAPDLNADGSISLPDFSLLAVNYARVGAGVP